MLLRLALFVYIDIRPIPHTSAYRLESKLFETDGADETCIEWVPYMPETTVQEFSN